MAWRRGFLAAVVLAATGCATSPGGAAGGPPLVVATTNVWGSILGELGGTRVQAVSLITNPNTDPHDYEPTPADARTMARSRLLVENGIGYDAWAARTLGASPDSRRVVVDVGTVVGLSAGANPHRWYSPDDVELVATAITSALERVAPGNRTYFEHQHTAFERQDLARYHTLIADVRAQDAGVPVGASESIAAPLAEALGLDLVTPAGFLQAVSEGIEPSAADKVTIDRQIRDHLIKVYVVNPQNSTPDVTAQVDAARSAGIPVVSMTETLRPAGALFQDWQVAQLTSLRDALRRATGR